MRADILECTGGTDVLDALREVGPKKEREVDKLRAIQLENITDFGAGYDDERTVTAAQVANQRRVID